MRAVWELSFPSPLTVGLDPNGCHYVAFAVYWELFSEGKDGDIVEIIDELLKLSMRMGWISINSSQ